MQVEEASSEAAARPYNAADRGAIVAHTASYLGALHTTISIAQAALDRSTLPDFSSDALAAEIADLQTAARLAGTSLLTLIALTTPCEGEG
jgi:hypothetical protein